ncbi:MAG: hypothetical protein EBR09_13880, partial [Proteobacteria bacterium]|nr:hypothetical protein [Pseudomonadota bacterium]
MTFAEIATGLNLLDVEDVTTTGATRYNTMRLRIEQIVDGQEIRLGTTSVAQDANPLVIDGTSNVIGAGSYIFWKPPAGLTAVSPNPPFTAFRVTAVDTGNLSSTTMGDVKIYVSGANAAPYMNTANTNPRVYNFGATLQGVPFTLTYDTLKTAFDVRDSDSPYIVFVVTSTTQSTLKKGTVTMAGTTPVNGSTPAGTAVIAPNESVVVFPNTSRIEDAAEIFRVRLYDGETYSDATTGYAVIKADLKVNNQIPTLTSVKNFTNVQKGGNLLFTYSEFRGDPSNTSGSERTNAFDAEENVANAQTLKFKVKSIPAGNGTLYKLNTSTSNYDAVTVNAEIEPNTSWKWTPDAALVGTVPAFTVVAWDGVSESAAPVTVNVEVTPTNTPPAFVGAGSDFSGAFEDIPYRISYSVLSGNHPSTDDQAGALTYEVTAISNGTLYKNSTELSVAANNLPASVRPTDTLTWIPPALQSGLKDAFTIRLKDDAGSLSATRLMRVNISAVNNLPVMGVAGAFPNTGANAVTGPLAKNAGVSISYDQLAGILPVTDADATGGTPASGDITYRIESVNSGLLFMGTSDTGASITPSQADFANMKRVVKTGANGTSTTAAVYWKPPVNGSGTFSVMTVRAFDGTDYSANVREVLVTIASSNAAPIWSNAVVNAAYEVTLGMGTTQNGALPVTYDTLLAATNPTDADGNVVRFRLSTLSSGSLKVGSTLYDTAGAIATPLLIGPGESFIWRPASNTVGTSGLNAFKVTATDTNSNSTNEVQVKVPVSGVNQAPTINAAWTVASPVSRNDFKALSFQEIAQNLGVLDFEDANSNVDVNSRFATMKLYIDSMIVGQEIRIGTTNSAAGADTLSDGNRLITSANWVFWKPPTNQSGTFEAFRVAAVDTGNAFSGQLATVSITVDGSNALPTMGAVSKVYDFGNRTQGVPLTVTYAQLAAALQPADSDNNFMSFVVTSITNSTLKKGGINMVAFNANTGTPPTTDAVISQNESVVVFPTATGVGNTVFFKVRVWDGEGYSTTPANEATVQANLTPFNQRPVLTYVKPFSGITEGGSLVFSYSDFRSGLVNGVARTNAFDAEEPLPTTTVKFRLKSILSGNLEINGGAAITAPADFAAGATWKWTPPLGASGALNAFTVVALDDAATPLESDTPITVIVNVGSKPVFTTASVFAGGSEDIPYTITYNNLAANYPGSDDQGTPLTYEITGVSSGQLFKGVTEITGATVSPAVAVRPGDILTWVPAPYANNVSNGGSSLNAFKIKLLDDAGNRSSETTVAVSVASVNNPPIVQSVTNPYSAGTPAGVVKNTGKIITHNEIWSMLTVKDYDFPSGNTSDANVSFRVEVVPTGKLYLGSSAASGETNLIQPTQANTASMPLLVKTGGNGTTSGSNLFWIPPQNGSGTFTIMRIRAFDGTDYAATTTDINVTIAAANSTPAWSATTVTLPNAASENGALPVTWETLASLTSPTDADGEVLRFKVTEITTGSVKVGEVSYTGTPLTPPSIGPGESFIWRPGAVNNTVTAFSIRATDGTADTSTAVTVQGTVTAVNDAPTMNSLATLTGASRNQWFEVKFETLRAALNMNDAETPPAGLQIKVEQKLSGLGVKLGAESPTGSATSATPWSISLTNTITAGQSIWWLPPVNIANTIPAFTVSVLDASNVASGNIATVNVTVTGSNAAPTLTAGNLDRGTYAQGTPFAVSYAQLASQFAPADTDSAMISFVVTSVSNATLKKGSNIMAAVATVSGNHGTPDSTNIIAPDEIILVIPSAAGNGSTTTLFTVKAWDGDVYSSNAGNVRATFTAPTNNLVPVLSYVRDFTGAVKDTVYPFTYAALRSGGTPARSDAFDAEENVSVPSLKFKVKTIYSTNGKLCAGGDGTCTGTALVAGQLIDSDTNSSFNWKPEAGLTGRLKAFSVVAYDDKDESVTPIDVYFQVTGPNASPVLGTVTSFTGAHEDVPYNISYDLLKSKIPVTDDQVAPVEYKITAILAGTLMKNYSTAVVANTTTVGVNDVLTWTPAANSNSSIPAFKVMGVDASGALSAEATATVLVAAIND